MRKVLAAIDNSAAARPVLATAAAVAQLLEAEVEGLHIREDGDRTARAAADAAGVRLRTVAGPGIDGLIRAGQESEVAAMVIGARASRVGRRPVGHVAAELIVALRKPLVVVPPQAPVPFELRQILVPLNGTEPTTAALASTIELACGSDIEVVVLHVHDHSSLPLFSDQPQHEVEAWAHEFLARHCPHPERARLEVRIGVPAEQVLRVVRETTADLIALGWAQDLSGGRAAVVREVLERSDVPVLLVPVPAHAARRTRLRARRAASVSASGLGR